MERDFNDDYFEVFLKQKADQYKIYPAERVWKNVYNSFHSRKKWFAIGGSLLAITALLFLNPELVRNGNRNAGAKNNTTNNSLTNTKTLPASPAVNPFEPDDKSILTDFRHSSQFQSLVHFFRSGSSLKSSTFFNRLNSGAESALHPRRLTPALAFEHQSLPLPLKLKRGYNIDVKATVASIPAEPQFTLISGKVVDPEQPVKKTTTAPIGRNWLQETAAIKLTQPKKSPYNLQFYFSPTVSYRRLADNKFGSANNQQNLPLAYQNSKIDRYVDHNPSVGAELGSNILFAASKNFTIKTGLQLNYSRYSIKAYRFYFEKASIALNSVTAPADTLTSYTSFRNFGGYSPEQLQNQYLQISMPIGAELKLIGNKNLRFTIAGTVQPSYLLFNDTYLLSTDYVNYAKEPSLVRKWNVHTSVEAFVSYKYGGVTWQFGPQFRYQLLSSFSDRYPIKEYLMEYGFKVGISKTLK